MLEEFQNVCGHRDQQDEPWKIKETDGSTTSRAGTGQQAHCEVYDDELTYLVPDVPRIIPEHRTCQNERFVYIYYRLNMHPVINHGGEYYVKHNIYIPY